MTSRSEAADLALVLDAVRAAGEVVLRVFRTDPEVHHKEPDQPVTEADLEADALLADRLRSARPEYGWLSEETADGPERLGRERVWIVDPIDGTRSFIAGYPEFAISVGLVEAGAPVLGVVYNPARETVYWAVRGGGAFRAERWRGGADGERVRIAAAEPGGGQPSVLASRSEIDRGELAGLEPEWVVRPVGSTAYKLAGVAEGSGDAFISRGPKSEWDVVAGALIVIEAGGRVTDLAGASLVYNRPDPYVHGIVAGGAAAHGRLLRWAAGRPAPRLRTGETSHRRDEA